jgi:signal transduction histidine kinase
LPTRLREHVRRLSPRRRTVRLRLTVLHAGLFLATGCGVILATYLLAVHQNVIGHFEGAGAPPSGGLRVNGTTVPIAPGRGWIRLPTTAELDSFFAESWILLVIMGVLSAGLGWLVAGRALRPLRTMSATTRRISEQNLHERLALPGPRDELTDLGDTIDGLLGRLETAFDAQRRFIANASHELHTPLAMMRTSLDVAVGKPGPVPPEVTVLAAKLGEGLDRAGQLLESLLVLARANSAAVTDRSTVSLSDLARDALAAHRPALTERGLTVGWISARRCGDTEVIGNGMLLARLADNILDNAVRHNEPAGWIWVVAEARDATARLTVENGGPVLNQREVSQLGQPFLRLGADRAGSADGTGLGLSIVAAITAAHHGTLSIHGRPEGGLSVVVELPRVTRPATAGASV